MALVQAALGCYAAQNYALLALALRAGADGGLRAPAPPPAGAQWPVVTVQLPVYNERFVVARLIRAVAALDYPRDRLRVQVLDDSTDETPAAVAAALAEAGLAGAAHVRRTARTGFKAGALAAGAALAADSDFLALFDADFVPPRDFLRRLVPLLLADASLGCVQARWGFLNRDEGGLVTRLQALGHDGHFVVEQQARSWAGLFLNFNGTAGVWRRECVLDAGGWTGDTLAEDLDLSYRVQMTGRWRIGFVRDLVVPSELPADMPAFRLQQRRWARGSVQVARKLLPRLLFGASPVPLHRRLMGAAHLCGYLCYPLMLVNLALHMWAVVSGSGGGGGDVPLPVVVAIAAAPPLIVVGAQLILGRADRLWLMPMLLLLHSGLSLSNALAIVHGPRGFERTPKGGYRAPVDARRAELALAAAILCVVVYGLWTGVSWGLLPLMVFQGVGLVMVWCL